jgi:hypothetical protein
MKLSLFAIIALALSPIASFAADEKLDGEAKCAKCHLKTETACHAVVVVKGADGKETVYYTEKDDNSKEIHSEICKEAKPVKVEGTVTEKDGKKMLKVTKYEFKK